MKNTVYRLLACLTVFAFLLGACGETAEPQPTPDVAIVATSAVQTSEARFTQQALVDLATRVATTPESTPAPAELSVTATPEATTVSYEYTPGCVFATYVADLTIPDGMILAPGAKFTKTWRIKNSGSCKWDATYALVFFSGDQMSEQNSFPLPRTIYPGQEVDLSVALTAPTTNGNYKGEWRLAIPAGGSAGVGKADDNLTVSIEVTNKPERDFGVTSVVYGPIVRNPAKGCTSKGATYTFSATINVNGPGEIVYEWDRYPDDGVFEGGKLKFSQAGSQEVLFTWTMTADHVQNIDRWVAVRTEYGGNISTQYERILFNYKCDE